MRVKTEREIAMLDEVMELASEIVEECRQALDDYDAGSLSEEKKADVCRAVRGRLVRCKACMTGIGLQAKKAGMF